MVRILIMTLAALGLSCLLPSTDGVGGGQPIVVITFDDGSESIYSIAFRAMRQTDSTWGATHFLPATWADAPGCVTTGQLQEMERAGWETGGHGVHHANLTSIPLDSVETEVKGSYDWLVSSGLSHMSFAYPSGNYNADVQAIVARWFVYIRTSHDLQYDNGITPRELGYFAVKPAHTVDDVIARVERARAARAPLVVIGFHTVVPDTAEPPVGAYWCRETLFRQFLDYVSREELPVKTLRQAMTILGYDRN